MSNNANKILLANNFINVKNVVGSDVASVEMLATVLANFVHYGWTASKELVDVLSKYSESELISFWAEIEHDFKELTFSNKEMDEFVVYKNFPSEVLSKSDAEYWFAQILMYAGFNYEFFTEDSASRPKLEDKKDLKILKVSKDDTLLSIFQSLIASKNRWNDVQSSHAIALLDMFKEIKIDLSSFGFKENGIIIVNKCILEKREFKIKDATDVLRLAAAMSDQDVSLRTKVKFKKFTRAERKMLLSLLDKTNNLEDDVAMRQSEWKKFIFQLHPSDYSFKNVKNVYGKLYRGELKSFNAKIESHISNADEKALQMLSSRSGDVLRRFHKLYEVFGEKAVETLVNGIDKFDTIQLLKLKKYVTTINNRNSLIYAPKGNWTKAVFVDFKEKEKMENKFTKNTMESKAVEVSVVEDIVEEIKKLDATPSIDSLMLLKDKMEGKLPVEAPKPLYVKPTDPLKAKKELIVSEKVKINSEDIIKIVDAINAELKIRMEKIFPEGVALSEDTKKIKLQTNDQKLAANYGRGTEFNIPENITFIRSGSYWQTDSVNNTWFDNGWNFFNDKWESVATCCWNSHSVGESAIFSGDPVVSQTDGNKGCQMIDLYLDKLQKEGIRYAVWNILAYSHITFDDAKDVVATLQMGENAETGNLYEPSRAQFSFEVKGQNLTKYVAYIDIIERKIVYMDANLAGNVMSAVYNAHSLSDNMPKFVEYLNTLPSVYDLFESVKAGTTPVIYCDKDINIEVEEAFVFNHVNSDNEFKNIDINDLLKK